MPRSTHLLGDYPGRRSSRDRFCGGVMSTWQSFDKAHNGEGLLQPSRPLSSTSSSVHLRQTSYLVIQTTALLPNSLLQY